MSRYASAGPSTLSRRDRTTLAPTSEYRLDARGPSPNPSSRSSPLLPQWSRSDGVGGERSADDLESQNEDRLEGLSAKVKMLKDLSIGIGNEVRESTIQLSQMNDAFAETGGILAGTFRRMNGMASRQGGRWCWFMLFLILVFWIFVITWLFR